jgi:hypothetical protein
MSLNDGLLFAISLCFLGFYYMIFNSDIFIESALSGPDFSRMILDGTYVTTLLGDIVIMIMMIMFYAATYMLLINLM